MRDIVTDIQDLTYLSWSKYRRSSGTAGSFLKSYETVGGHKIYYKLSSYDAFNGITGHECINEIIADRLLTLLDIAHLHYQLIHARVLIDDKEYVTWLCASEDYKQPGESKVALDVFYQLEKEPGESPLAFCIRQGWADHIYKMLIIDFLILNRDRHGANMEVLKSRKTHSIRLAPLFDHGLSLFFSCHSDEEILREDVMKDKSVQCFVGSGSAMDNLSLIPGSYDPDIRSLSESDDKILFNGLENTVSDSFRFMVWKMIWERWNYYESIRHKR